VKIKTINKKFKIFCIATSPLRKDDFSYLKPAELVCMMP
jgi:hypothetical protein